MPRTLVWFSCGAASAVTAKITLKDNPDAIIAYCDTGSEHEDNARFLKDCEKWFGKKVEILKSEKYEDVWEVFDKRRFLVGPTGALCTAEMKKIPRFGFQEVDDIQAFGYTKEESHRADRFREQNPDITLITPLIDAGLSKADCLAMIKRAGIELPEMYKLGYRNNNCVGCVKGGAGYWNKIRVDFPEVFDRMSKVERHLNRQIIKLKDGRVFLDELDPTVGRYKAEPDIACDLVCGAVFEEIEVDNVEQLREPIVEQAIKIAELGLKVIPATGKRCHIPKWQERATSDPDEIRQLFSEQNDATHVAVVCGQSGLFVVDLDINKGDDKGPDGIQWALENRSMLPETRVHSTPSGGYHMLYFMPKGAKLGNIDIAHKVDSRGMSGYIIWPTEGSGYEVYKDRPVVTLPKSTALKWQQKQSEITQLSKKDISDYIITDASDFSLHALSTQLIYLLVKEGLDADEVMTVTRAVMEKSEAKLTRPEDWQKRYDDVPRSATGAIRRHSKVNPDADARDDAFAKAFKDRFADAEVGDFYRQGKKSAPDPVIDDSMITVLEEIKTLKNTAAKLTPWVIEGVIEQRAITGIAGTSNVGKTRFIVSLAMAVASGYPFTGHPVAKTGGVLIISKEERKAKMERRIAATALLYDEEAPNLQGKIAFVPSEKAQALTLLQQGENRQPEVRQAAVDLIVKWAKDLDVVLIIFDPLVAFSSGISENSSDMDELMGVFRYLCDETGAAIALAHHTPKGGGHSPAEDWYKGNLEAFRGSSAIAAAIDIGFTISRIGKAHDSNAGKRGIAEQLGTAECRRWLRLAQAKGRDTLMNTDAVYYLHDQPINVVGGGTEGVGALKVMSEKELLDAAMDAADNKSITSMLRNLLLRTLRAEYDDDLTDVSITTSRLITKMHELDPKVITQKKPNQEVRDRVKALFPFPVTGGELVLNGRIVFQKT